MSSSHMPGGFSRAISRGHNVASPEQAANQAEKKANDAEKKDVSKIESHAREVSIRKEPDGKGGHKYTVKHEGHVSEHPDHKSAAAAAAHELGEVAEPESAENDVPQENPLGMAPSDNDADDGL